MTRHIFIFLGTFLLGALVALGARTARHTPPTDHAATGGAVATATAPAPQAPAATAHSAHSGAPAAAATVPPAAPPSSSSAPVNTVCAICGMDVDPKLPTATYQGKTIGFGCRMCPPKFAAEPDKYGPLYLRNEVVTR